MARVSGAALRRSIDCLVTHDSIALLPKVTAQTTCIVGDLDEETPVGYAFALADLIPGARLAVIPQAGHLLNVEAPEAVNRLLEVQMAEPLEAR
jgi:pimeloyl-ACP methyl ester carboxylesterase